MHLWYFFLSSVFVAFLPGPAMGLVVQASIEKGWKQGLAITAGIILADTILLLCVCLGLGELLTSSDRAVLLLNIFTSTYLIYLGCQTIYTLRHIKDGIIHSINNLSWKNGFTLTLVSPKTIIFLLAYLPQFIINDSSTSQTAQLLLLSVIFIIAVTLTMLFYTFLASFARQYLLKEKVRIVMNVSFGLLLIALGLQNFYNTFFSISP